MSSPACSMTQTGTRVEVSALAGPTRLGALAASIAHEIDQPLTGVANASTCLRIPAADPPNVDGAFETARRTIRDGNRTTDMIKQPHILFGMNDATTGPADPNQVTREVIAFSFNELGREWAVLRPELARDLPLVTGDLIQLQQVIFNLLRSTPDAMSCVDDCLRDLLIRAQRDEDDYVRLTVQGTGVSIDPRNADKVFDAFYTTKSAGMGIGMCAIRTIVESHHGHMWAAPNDGQGAAFSFSIPCSSLPSSYVSHAN